MNFNEQQIQAINHYKGACAVIAGAGSGKSTVLVNRIKNLVDTYNVPEKEILAISFTKNTRIDLKNKLNKMGYNKVNVGTFHSICYRILTEEGMDLSQQIKEWQIENLFMDKKTKKKRDTKDIMEFISYQKNYLRSFNDEFMVKDSKYTEEELRQFYKQYEEFKKENNLYDFEDYLIECYKLLKNNPGLYTYDFVLVDEHQDSNLVQNLLLKELCKSGNIFCVFDYRQAIYTFRGGNPEYSMNFDKEWDNPTIINLDINYRSKSNIVDKANNFIKPYYGNYTYYSDSIPNIKTNGNIKVNTYSEKDLEAIDVVEAIERLLNHGEDPKEIAVLYRLNSQSGNVEYELRKRGIDYDIANESNFFRRREISGLLAYLKLIVNPHDDEAFTEITNFRNYPLMYFSDKLFSEIRIFAGENNMSMYEGLINFRYEKDWQRRNMILFREHIENLRLQRDKGLITVHLVENIVKVFQLYGYIYDRYSSEDEIDERIESINTFKSFIKSDTIEKFLKYIDMSMKKKKNNNCIKLMTIHSSKGLEFKHVFIIGVEDGKFPHDRSELLDEVRLFYVGVTRAKDNLYVSQIYDGNKFVEEYVGEYK